MVTREFYEFNQKLLYQKEPNESWYQKTFFKNFRFRSSYLEEDILSLTKRVKALLFLGEITTLQLGPWFVIFITALRTFKKKKKKKYRIKKIKQTEAEIISPALTPTPEAEKQIKPPVCVEIEEIPETYAFNEPVNHPQTSVFAHLAPRIVQTFAPHFSYQF